MLSGHSIANLLRAGFEQRHRLLVLHTPLGANRLLAETLEGVESIDEGGFRLDLSVLADDAHIPLKQLVGQAVRLDMQTQHSRSDLRPLHGHVSRAELVGSNGGFARYRLVIEPWLAFLRWRQDSFLFQDRTVFDIVESVFADYQGQGKLNPQWRWDVTARDSYPQRGITTQYRETDHAFVTRLLAEEGLFYWFEHEAGDGATLGQHTLVIADHNGAFRPNAQPTIRYHRADSTEREDAIMRWEATRQLHTNSLGAQSWDYKRVGARPLRDQGQAGVERARTLHWQDDPGAYAWENAAQGERHLTRALEALALRNKGFSGESTVRTLAPASTFALADHFDHAGGTGANERFAVLRVAHSARNNFDEDLQRAANAQLCTARAGQGDSGNEGEAVPHYRNHFVAVRANIAYRPLARDGHGRAIHPKPTVHGTQSAVVTGAGDPVHTDRDHRIKVQFHWQRGGQSSSRGDHPAGECNAPAASSLGAWLRVSAGMAGDNWGQVALPRVGQEVLVDFLNGDIDRPVIVGAVYNGAGETDAQHNRQAAGSAQSTGNAPAWFAGKQGEHAHNAVFSGIKTQALAHSQRGSGGFNQLVFDDTPGQPRPGLSTTQAHSRLHLGHHKQQTDNQRGADRGHGAELATQAQGAVRAGAGLLVSAHAQTHAAGPFMASREAQAQTTQARELAESLVQSAQAQGAQLAAESTPDRLAPVEALRHIAEVLAATQEGEGGGGASEGQIKTTAGGQGRVTAYREPHLQLSAPMGIGMATPAEMVLASGVTSTVAAQQDINALAQGQMTMAVAKGVSLYTVGTTAPAGKPNQERGIALHAASGAVRVQSQAGKTTLAADKTVTIASTAQDVAIEGETHALMTVAGAYVRLEGSTVKVHAPGRATFRASAHEFVGPGADAVSGTTAQGALRLCEMKSQAAATQGAALVPLA